MTVQANYGQLCAPELGHDGFPTGREIFIQAEKVAAIVAVRPNGPTEFIFDGGGRIMVCGGAEIWRRELRLACLTLRKREDRTDDSSA